jgi:bifunctional DNA-binding transcriptional regulator/antitoxin component of YhaV-PrlF toxin-antitoxin module
MVAEELAVSSNGTITVPARFQAHQVGSCYNQEVHTRVETPDGPTEAMEFTAFVTASSCITIPSEIREFGNIEAGEDIVSVEMEATGNTWSPENGGRTDYTGENYAIPDEDVADDEEVEEAIESADEQMEDEPETLGELFSTEPDDEVEEEEDDQEEEGLGELFG